MAKLGKVRARWVKETETPEDDRHDLIRWDFAIREDGAILRKLSVHYRPDADGTIGAHWHDWGWTVTCRGKERRRSDEEEGKRLARDGYTKVKV